MYILYFFRNCAFTYVRACFDRRASLTPIDHLLLLWKRIRGVVRV